MQHDAGILIYKMVDSFPEFLFLKRKEGWLDITKGHIEEGEDKAKAALREAREESGLSLSDCMDKHFMCSVVYEIETGSGNKEKKELTVFIAESSGDAAVTISSEHIGYVWKKYEEAMSEIKKGWQLSILPCAYDYIMRKEQMSKLNAEYSSLPSKISPWNLSTVFVPGEGPLNAKVMFVGQAPGAQEDAERRPFIGRSGQLLGALIRSAGLRRENTYITSVVQFFPPKNRVPTDKEVSVCRGFLYRQMDIIKPRLVVLLGAVAAKEVLGIKGISSFRGTILERNGTKYFLSLHPAAAIRIKSNMPKIEEDFKKLGQLVSSMDLQSALP
ncbi:MAG: uracil-DNA glycosylase family protein [Candidatus Micrarchaeia archaeon]